jgi:hypothetical protein
MPVIPPNVPHNETRPKDRILKKYAEYMYEHGRNTKDANSLQGERYEIAVAVHLYNHHKLGHGQQIGRWTPTKPGLPPPAVSQDVTIGHNTEYDFYLRGTANWPNLPVNNRDILGEAKSYNNGLGTYIKKAVTYCMHDRTLGGLCFVTPQDPYFFFLYMMQQVHSVLANPVANSQGIAGGDSWRFHHGGPQIVAYFSQEYGQLNDQNRVATYQDVKASQVTGEVRHSIHPFTGNQVSDYYRRRVNKRLTANFLNQELMQHAGIVAFCLQVPTVTHDQLRDLMGNMR